MFKKAVLALALAMLLTSCGEPIQLAPDAILPDGGVYQGEIKDGLFHGHGTLKYVDGSYYEGLFDKGVYHGKGRQVFADGSSYTGAFFEGRVTGKFIMQIPRENLVYEGDLLDGYMHGQGTLTAQTYVYTGGFKDRYFEGKGKITYTNGIVYEGGFSEGIYNGLGVFLGEDGSRYEGQFKDNYYHGEGKIVYANGSVYQGGFSEGVYQGHGRYSLDDSWYEGTYVAGELSGQAEYVDSQGNYYKGEANVWQPSGKGQFTQADGVILKGAFEYGSLEGLGEKINLDGSSYRGHFQYSQYDGAGILSMSDGSIYDGEFSYGLYHGPGTLTRVDQETGDKVVLGGKWNRGQLVYNEATGVRQHVQAELALEQHQALLQASLSGLSASDENSNVYFLGIAGDGGQSVFRRELEFVSEQIEQRYETQGRSVVLVNHHDTAELYPMATSRSIASSISSISQKMDNDNDVLFMYLTSHGSSDHDFYLNHDSIRLPAISPKELKEMLDTSKVKWRVIMVSACYSGGFISELQDEHTLLMTAADAESQSFGCSEESEMTYFGKAFFREVFSKNDSVDLVSAFSRAKNLILEWEKEQELDASNPMISAPQAVVEKMAAF